IGVLIMTIGNDKSASRRKSATSALAEALEHPETRTEVSEALRGLIDGIVLTPNQGELQIELKGNLAAMLGAATNARCKLKWLRGRDLNSFLIGNHGAFGAALPGPPPQPALLDQEVAGIWR